MKSGVVAIGMVVLTACGAAPPPASAGSAATPLELTLVSNDGQLETLPFAGAKTVVDYFAPNCEPCRKKLPALVARRADLALHGARLALVGVLESSDSTASVEGVLASWGLADERFFIDREGVSARVAKVTEFPTTQVFDATRSLRWVGHAASTEEDVLAAVAGLP